MAEAFVLRVCVCVCVHAGRCSALGHESNVGCGLNNALRAACAA